MKILFVLLPIIISWVLPVQAQTLITLDSFNFTNGRNPQAGLMADAAGNLFGTSTGTAFEIAKTGSTFGSISTLATIPGLYPDSASGLIADAAGNLFGTTYQTGPSSAGSVFEITKSGSTYGTLSTLVNFNGTNGGHPKGSLMIDAAGNLFGTTRDGPSRQGTVFEIAKTGSTYGSLNSLVTFNGANGAQPQAGLIADAAGNLFGTTSGGTSSFGTVFEIAKSGSAYGALTTLSYFDGTAGTYPSAGLIADAAGNLFGTTVGGGPSGKGTVFEIPASGSAYGSLTTLSYFDGTAGTYPSAGLIADAAGNLFGTTSQGGTSGVGTVFEISKTGSAYGSPTTLVNFNNTNGEDPLAALIADSSGNLFGTTSLGGASGAGTVFEITNSGFVTSLSNTTVAEPASMALVGAGGVALAAIRRRTGGKKLIRG